MVIVLRILVLLWGGLCAWPVSAELGVLAPVLESGEPLRRPDSHGKLAPVVTRVASGALYQQLQTEARTGFTGTVLALDAAAQRAAGAATPSTTWLYLAVEDGGFARRGFWLRDDAGERFVPDLFVDLVVDEDSIADGGFEEIFAHEMGHVFLRRLLPSLPQGYSRTPHHSFSITDYPTAFDEGFATHFQGLVRRLTHNTSLRNQDLGLEFKPVVPYWQSNIDRAMRIDGVRRNWFVQAQIAIPGDEPPLIRRENSTLFDNARLKNGNQMMASEGVIATLFYRWLVPGSGETPALVERYQRLFAALTALNERELAADSPVFLDLVESYAQLYPAERARVTGVLIDTTYGATTDASVAATIEAAATPGRIGEMRAFVAELGAARKVLSGARDAVVQSPNKMRGGLGPNIWLLSDAGISINLNTAELEDLLQIPGLDVALAERALDSRRRAGYFRSVADFATRTGLDAPVAGRLADMRAKMEQAGTFPRE